MRTHGIHGFEEDRRSLNFDISSTRYQLRIDDGMQVDGISNVTDVLGEVVGNTTLSCRVGSTGFPPEWPLKCSKVEKRIS